MTLADLRLPCEHGRYEAHGMVGFEDDAVVVYDRSDCPGGRSATIEDLTAPAERVRFDVIRDHGGNHYVICADGSLEKNDEGYWALAVPSGVTAEEE